MKHLKVTSIVLTIAICMSMFMPTVSVLADEASAPSETQSTEETEIQKPKETEKPAPKETAKPKETEPSEKKETEATEKPSVQETEKQEPEKQEPAETDKQIPAETEKTEPAETKEQEPAETDTQKPTETEKQEPVETEEQQPEQTESQTPEETEEQGPEITEAPVQETEVQKAPKNAIDGGSCGDTMNWTISDGVVTITGTGIMESSGWLKYKNQITTVNIGEGVGKLCEGAFAGCSKLTEVSFPSSLYDTGEFSFQDCTSLETVTVPFNVAFLSAGTFSGCTKLKNVSLKCNIDIIEVSCFENCTSLTSIKLPDQATIIANFAFRGCTRLSSVTLPTTLKQIQSHAFEGCTSFTKFTVPYGVSYIGDESFKNCTGLTSVELVSVNQIGKNAFEGCTGLTTVKLPVSLDIIWSGVFAGCSSLTDVHYGGTETQWNNIEIDADNVPLLKATLHTTESSSFNGTNGTIGTNLTWELGKDGILTISGSGAMSNFDSNNYGGSYYFYKAPWNNYKSKIIKVVISSGVTSIGNGAFNGCSNLTSITMPDTISEIGRDAFINTSISSLTIPSGVTIINNNTFKSCTSFTSVTIPSSVTEIGEFAFAYCSNLVTVNLSNGTRMIDSYAFLDDSKLKEISFPASLTRIDYSAFSGTGFTEITIPSNIKFLGGYAFSNCLDLTKVTFSSGLQKIGSESGVFSKCKNLKTVIIPDTVTQINNYAFIDCTGITDVYYSGTQDGWNSLPGSKQDALKTATIHYGSTGETEYFIEVVSCEHGSITFSKNPAPAGEVITARITPDEGYAFNYIDIGGTMYGKTFTMPASNIRVKVIFSKNSYNLTVNHSSGGTANYPLSKVSVGGSVTIYCEPEEGYVVANVKVNDIDNGTSTTFEMPARDTVVYVTFAKKGYNINLITGSNGTASLNKTSADAGDKITVTATPNNGYVLDQIIVNEVPLKSGVYEFTMGAGDTTVEVTFKKAPGSITVSVPNGGGTASANAASAEQGETIKISYTASEGYKLDKITLNGSAITGNTFPMPAGDAKVAVYFTKIQYTITADCSAGGTVTCSPTSAGVGETITIKPISETGYTVDSVKVNNETVDGFTFKMPARNTTVYVKFVRGGYPVNLTVGPNGDATVSNNTAGYGDEITVTYKPATGYVLDAITVDGKALPSGVTKFTMGAAATNVKVTFKKASYNVNVSVHDGGGTAGADVAKAGYGDSVKISYSATAGYELDKILLNGEEITGNTFSMPAETAEVVVYFKKIQFTITADCSTGGTVSCKPTTAGVGEKIDITAKPATGYSIESIKVNDKVIEGNSFDMPAKNTTVYVKFAKTVYDVNLIVGKNGTASVSPAKATMGDKITITYKPATGYILDTITVNKTALPSGETEFTMGAASVDVEVSFKKAAYSISISSPEGGSANVSATSAGYLDSITITPTANAGYEFDKITVNGVEKTGKTFEMPAEDVAVVAYFKKIDYKVNLKDVANGTASVSKTEANYGDTITVSVSPDPGYVLDKIKVNGTALAAGVKEFTMGTGEANVEVTFKLAEYDINVLVPEGGSASTKPSSASAGTSVTVTTTPDTGYEFDKITLNGETVQGKSFTMPADEANVVVYFKMIDYDINLNVGDNGNASVSKNPANYGDIITVTATPDAGYVLDTIKVNGTALKKGVTTFTMEASTYSVDVSFKKTQFPISVSVSGVGGTASAKTSAAAEEWVEIACNHAAGYEVDKITVNGLAIAGTGFSMPAKPANVVVSFKKAVYKLTLVNPVGGTAKLSKTSAYYGESITVTTGANTGYELDKIYVNGSAVSSKESFTMPASDAEVEVVYKLIDYDITVEYGPNGTASVPKSSANYGDKIVITATPNSRYTIDTIKVNGTELVDTLEFTMGNEPAKVEVTFKRADYTISSSVSGGNGKISVVKMANEGDRVAVECTPNTGYTVDKILVNNAAITGTAFTMPDHDTTVVVSFKLAVYSISINKPTGGTATLSKSSANYGEQITVTATPSTGYRLKSIMVNDRVIEIERFSMPDEDANVVVTFEKIEYEISLNQPIGGTVSVDKNPANYKDKITVTATPSEGYILGIIKVNGTALKTGVKTFTMGDGPADVEVTFNKIQYSISVTYSAGGTASPDPKKAGINDTVSIIPKPNDGYEVEYITVNDEPGEKTFLMPAKNTKVYVKFRKIDYKLTVACGANGEAGVDKDQANIGDKITVNLYPNPGYELDFIKVNDKQITGNTFTMGAGDTTVEVHFKLKALKVKVIALTGGTATANTTTAKMGETVTLTVTPADGYELSYIMVNGKKASTSFEMDAEDAEVTVAFAKIPYKISLNASGNGTAKVGTTTAVIGEQITVEVTPDENYIAVIKVNGETIGDTLDTLTFTMPASNVTVTVTFERVRQLDAGETGKIGNATYTVTGVAPENGTGTVRLDKIVDNGTAAVVIPDTVSIKGYTYRVTSISSYALANNPSMTSLKIGAYVTSVGNYAASGCKNLTKVYGGNRLKTIGTRAFNGCSRLRSFSISSAVLSKIGAYTFNGDRALKTIYVNRTTKLSKKGVKKSLKGSKVKTVKVKKSKVRKYKKIFTKRNCGKKVKVKK